MAAQARYVPKAQAGGWIVWDRERQRQVDGGPPYPEKAPATAAAVIAQADMEYMTSRTPAQRQAITAGAAGLQAPSLAKVRALVARGNGLQAESVVVRWLERPAPHEYPTGVIGLRGWVWAEAPGFRASRQPVSVDRNGTWVGL